MKNDFSKPQRQSLVGIFVMGADSLQKNLRALFPIAIVSFLGNEKSKSYFFILAGVIVIMAVIAGYLRYRNFTFFIDDENDEFVVRKGIFSKTRIAIPLNKIQQVNINQNLLHKLLRVHELEIDTAGSAKTEVSITAITEGHALALKERLLEETYYIEKGSDLQTALKNDKPAPFIQISFLSLLKTGITSNYVRSFFVLLAFFISIIQYIDDYFQYSGADSEFLDEYLTKAFFLKFVASIIFIIIALTIFVNLGRTLLRYYNFKVTKQQNTLLLSHGLINTRNTIIRPNKVQIVTVGRNYFQKKFNINDLKIRQASDLEQSRERQKMAMEIPGVNDAEKKVLLEFLLEKMPERGFMFKPNFRKVIFEVFKFIVIPVGLFYAYTLLVPDVALLLQLIPVYIAFVGLLIYFAFKNSRLFISPDFIIRQRGAWDVDNDYVAPHKIHTIKLTQYFWQKYSDVGTVKIFTAGGNINFGLANFTVLKKLTNYWLYQVETTDKNWM